MGTVAGSIAGVVFSLSFSGWGSSEAAGAGAGAGAGVVSAATSEAGLGLGGGVKTFMESETLGATSPTAPSGPPLT